MKNKKILIPIIIVIVIIIVAIIAFLVVKSNSDNVTSNEQLTEQDNGDEAQIYIEQNLYAVGNYTLNDEEKNKLIQSSEDLQNYLNNTYNENLDDLISMYGESYFEDRALALAYVQLDSSDKTVSVESLNIDENVLKIGYKVKDLDNTENAEDSSEETDQDKQENNAYIIVVETDKTLSAVTSEEIQ